MSKESLEVVFDNGGGVTVQCDGWAHYYEHDAARAAADVQQILAGADMSDWDGNEPEARVNWDMETVRNGGYKVYDASDLADIDIDSSWDNVRRFAVAFQGTK